MMIKVEPRKPSPEDCEALAELTLSARKGTPLETGRSLDEIAASIEKLSANKEYQILVALDEEGSLVGWIYYYVGFPLMTFISGFLPVVVQTRKTEKIALALIEASKNKIKEHGHNRLEIELELPTKAHRALAERIIGWYRKCGFQFAAEEVHMRSDLGKIRLPELDFPKDCTLKRFSEFSYEQLEGPGFQTFEKSRDDLFQSMNQAEQRVTLQHFFSKTKPFVEDSSIILEKAGKVVGFVITRMSGEEAKIGPIGVIPEARGQRLGSYLLATALKTLRDKGVKTAVLDTSVTNHPAMRLYQHYGFKEIHNKQFYYWSPR